MRWSFDSNRAIFTQLTEKLKEMIISGEIKAGEKLPSIRELSVTVGVTPTTMQKSLTQLEEQHLIITHRTSGKFVTEDIALIKNMRDEMALQIIADTRTKIEKLGYTEKEIHNLIQLNFNNSEV